MIDILIIIVFFAAYIIFEMTPMHDEVKSIIKLAIASSLLFYVALNVNDINVSKLFIALSIITFIMIPVVLIIKYIGKMK
jgi:hypothetical protein